MNLRVCSILILIAAGCSDQESPIPSPLTGNELVSMRYNDQYLVANSRVQVSYYNNTLEIFADSIYSTIGGSERYEFHLYGSANPGKNQILQDLYFELKKYESDGFLTQLIAVSGEVDFSELDVIEGNLSGSFDMTVKDVNENTQYQLTDGLLNNLLFIDLFCEADLPTYSHDSTSLYNAWGLKSILKSKGETINPPCGSNPSLWIFPETYETGEYIALSGTVNGAACNANIDQENQRMVTGESVVTLAYDNAWSNDFEQLYFRSLSENILSYEYTANELVILNEQAGVELVFVPVE